MIKVENIKLYIQEQKNKGAETFWAMKTAPVHARSGIIGEEIITQMADGHIETTNKIKGDDEIVITNPDNEQYIISAKKFVERYDIRGQYRPKAIPQLFIITKQDIEFIAPWNEVMSIKAGGVLNITQFETGDIYGIQENEFFKTYTACDKDGNVELNEKYTAGLTIMRAQPMHAGHEYVIRQMLRQCETGIVLVGSADAQPSERNPFTAHERMQMIQNVFADECLSGTLRIGKIRDLGNIKLWAGYVLAEVWRKFQMEPTAYYCGQGQDGKWFQANGMNVYEVSRDIIPISASEIRDALRAGDTKVLQHVHPANREMVANFFIKRCY